MALNKKIRRLENFSTNPIPGIGMYGDLKNPPKELLDKETGKLKITDDYQIDSVVISKHPKKDKTELRKKQKLNLEKVNNFQQLEKFISKNAYDGEDGEHPNVVQDDLEELRNV